MARRSGRFKAVDEDGDDEMVVGDQANKDEDEVEDVDHMDVDDVDNSAQAGGSKGDQPDEEEDEEAEVDTTTAGPAAPGDHLTNDMEVEVEAEIEANTSIGSTRPSRKAAQEATKKIEAGKVKIEDNTNKKGKGKGKGKAKVMSDSEESEVEEEVIKPKVKGKGKGKGKKEEIPSDAESEFEVETKPIKGGKKQILAKAVYWKDIPKWEKGSKSLLMELPGDIMDNIFGLREELGLAEYVALAGVCKTFRHHLNDDFFQAVCLGKGQEPKTHYDDQTQAWVSKPEIKGKTLATAPFSRGGEDWRVPTPRKYTYSGNDRTLKQLVIDQKPAISHYIPRGERSKWSKAQYTVYKEEKRATRKDRWAIRKPTLDAIAKDINQRTSSKYRSITDGNRNRTVLGEVPGRRNGEPAVEKDEKGIPIIKEGEDEEDSSDSNEESDGEEEDEEQEPAKGEKKGGSSKAKSTSPVSTAVKDASSGAKPPVKMTGSRKRVHVSESEESEDEVVAPPKRGRRDNNTASRSQPKSKSKKQASQAWVVPDSSDESTNELDYMREQGLKIVHDHWPSPWRVMAAALVNTDRINKSNALKKFKVTEAQLLTLKHHLVPNPMNNKQPMQLYIKPAVQALALRAHGGIAKHGAFLASAKDKTQVRAEKRKIKIKEMIFEGTYVHKRVEPQIPRWDWYYYRHYPYMHNEPCACADCSLMGQDLSMYDSDYDY